MGDSLGDRMKGYENAYRIRLPRRMPVLLRVDGKAWHTWTRNARRPFDRDVSETVDAVMLALMSEAQGAVFAYAQSDEISVLLHNYKQLNSEPWLDNGLQKIVSVAASVATEAAAKNTFNEGVGPCLFDCRAWVLPEAEVCNYFIWRQQDASRNSLQMLARAHFSHKQLHEKNATALHDMLHGIGTNWNDLPTQDKRGRCAFREAIGERPATCFDREPPVFTADRDYIERHLTTAEQPLLRAVSP